MKLSSCRNWALVALFCFLSSCATPARQWELEKTRSCSPCFQSAKLFLPVDDNFCGMEIELTQGHCGLRMYVNVFTLEFPYTQENDAKTALVITVDEVSQTIYADRFQGGQRLLLPPDASEYIILSLLANKKVDIRAGRFHSIVIPYKFESLFHRLNPSPFQIFRIA